LYKLLIRNIYKGVVEFKINKYQKSFALLWDVRQETPDEINEYISEIGLSRHEAKFGVDSDTLALVEDFGEESSGNFYVSKGEYLVHTFSPLNDGHMIFCFYTQDKFESVIYKKKN